MKQLAEALVAAQQGLHNLGKDAEGYGYQYVTLGKLIEETRGVLAAHGLAILQPMCIHDGRPAVKTVLLHQSGEFIDGVYPISAVTMKQCNDAQQMGAAISYARRYCLAAMLNITQTDDDAGCIPNEPQPMTHQSPDEIKAKALANEMFEHLTEENQGWLDGCMQKRQYEEVIRHLSEMKAQQELIDVPPQPETQGHAE